jgi:hypothetical protein
MVKPWKTEEWKEKRTTILKERDRCKAILVPLKKFVIVSPVRLTYNSNGSTKLINRLAN